METKADDKTTSNDTSDEKQLNQETKNLAKNLNKENVLLQIKNEFIIYLNKTSDFIKTHKTPTIISFVAIIVLVLGFILRPKRKFAYDQQIPYVWDSNLLRMMDSFFSFKEHDQFLLLYGPHGFGKTRAIREYAKRTQNSFMSFIFDFRIMSTTFTQSDLKELIKSQIINAFLDQSFPQLSPSSINSIIQTLTAITMLQNETEQQKQHTRKLHHSIKNTDNLHKDKQISKIISLLCDIAENFEQNPTMSFRLLFNAIDSMKEFNPSIYVIHCDNLLNSRNSDVAALFKTFLQSAIEFSKQIKRTPLIVEMSDPHNVNKTILDIPCLRRVYVSGFSQSEARDTLIPAKIFSKKDISTIFGLFGGDGRAFSQLMELMRTGLSLSDAIDAFLRTERERMSLALYSVNKNERAEKVKLLREISKKKEIPVAETEACKYLLEKNIITKTADSEHIMFQSKQLKKIFDESFYK